MILRELVLNVEILEYTNVNAQKKNVRAILARIRALRKLKE